jgi:hypothetical protein
MNILSRAACTLLLLVLYTSANAGEICRIHASGDGKNIGSLSASRASAVTGVNSAGEIITYGVNEISYRDGRAQSLPASGWTNLIDYSDPSQLSEIDTKNITTAQAYAWSCGGIDNAMTFDGSETLYAYQKATLTALNTYTLSAFIKMDDGSEPVPGTSSTDGDFLIVIDSNWIGAGNPATVIRVGDSDTYFVYATKSSVDGGADRNNGIIRYSCQSLRTFKVSGLQLTQSSYPLPYTPTNGSTVSVAGQTLTADIGTNAALRDALSDSDSYDTDGESVFTMLAVVVPRYDNPDSAHNLIGVSAGSSLLGADSSNDRFLSTDGTNTAYSSSSVFGDDAHEIYWIMETADSTADSGSGETQICTSTDFGENWSCGTKAAYDGEFALSNYLYIGYSNEYPFDIGPIIFYDEVLTTEQATTALSMQSGGGPFGLSLGLHLGNGSSGTYPGVPGGEGDTMLWWSSGDTMLWWGGGDTMLWWSTEAEASAEDVWDNSVAVFDSAAAVWSN